MTVFIFHLYKSGGSPTALRSQSCLERSQIHPTLAPGPTLSRAIYMETTKYYRKNSHLRSRKVFCLDAEIWAEIFKLDCLTVSPSHSRMLRKLVEEGRGRPPFSMPTPSSLPPMESCAIYSNLVCSLGWKWFTRSPHFLLLFAEAFNLLYLKPTEGEGVEISTFETSWYLLSRVIKGQAGRETVDWTLPYPEELF